MIREIISLEEQQSMYELIHELRTDVTFEEYCKLLLPMRDAGYRMFGLFEDSKVITISGVEIKYNLYYGKHLWVYDLVTSKTKRSTGAGKTMLEYLENIAKQENCNCVALSSGLQKERAHNFYLNHLNSPLFQNI